MYINTTRADSLYLNWSLAEHSRRQQAPPALARGAPLHSCLDPSSVLCNPPRAAPRSFSAPLAWGDLAGDSSVGGDLARGGFAEGGLAGGGFAGGSLVGGSLFRACLRG